jgi:hypothetical protein
MAHLGARISALLDGQLPAEETERAWAHVHTCHFCRDAVEREGWVKTRLAGLSFDAGRAPDGLKGSLLGMPPGDAILVFAGGRPDHRTRRNVSLAAIGGGAVGAAVVGVLALGAAPADAPTIDRRTPTSHLVSPTQGPAATPFRHNLP